MILFPPCKINLGLDITSKRADGYHDIETVMIPVKGLCDSLEIIPSEKESFSSSGLLLDCREEENIVLKAWKIMRETYGNKIAYAGLENSVRVHLHKAVPFGAGLGGGSSDAAFALRAINDVFSLGRTPEELIPIAAQLGSDVPFFLYNTPMLCTGRGEIMTPTTIDLKGYYIVVVKPTVSVSTAEAYAGVTPHKPEITLIERLARPISEWKNSIENAFEESVLKRYSVIGQIKNSLYNAGALYASMSGSGSAVYGLFNIIPEYSAADKTIESVHISRL